MSYIDFLNCFPEPQPNTEALAIRAAATKQIVALLNTVQALRDYNAELAQQQAALLNESARYKRALVSIIKQDETDAEDALVYVYGVAQSALDDLPF